MRHKCGTHQRMRLLGLVGVAVAAGLAAIGCGSPVNTNEVSGIVSYKGKPLTGGMIMCGRSELTSEGEVLWLDERRRYRLSLNSADETLGLKLDGLEHPLRHVHTLDFLPWQHVIVFEKTAEKKSAGPESR